MYLPAEIIKHRFPLGFTHSLKDAPGNSEAWNTVKYYSTYERLEGLLGPYSMAGVILSLSPVSNIMPVTAHIPCAHWEFQQ